MFEAKNDAVANRNFQQVVSGSATPDRFSLYYLGTWDTEQLVITPEGRVYLGDVVGKAVEEVNNG